MPLRYSLRAARTIGRQNLLNHFARLFLNPDRFALRTHQRRYALNLEHLALHQLLMQNRPSLQAHPALFAMRQNF